MEDRLPSPDDASRPRHNKPDTPDNAALLSTALSCYPIAKSLTPSLDLNDLHSLSLTHPSVHSTLLPQRHALIPLSLRCNHDETSPFPSSSTTTSARGKKLYRCARDLVAPCSGCGTVVCRNCTAKPPTRTALRARLRPLCTTCLSSPASSLCQCASSPYHICKTCAREREIRDVGSSRERAWRRRYGDVGSDGLGTGIRGGERCGRWQTCEGGSWWEDEGAGMGAGTGIGMGRGEGRLWVPATVDVDPSNGEKEVDTGSRWWCAWCRKFVRGTNER